MARLVKLTAYQNNVVSGYAVDLILRVEEVAAIAAIPAVPAVTGSDGPPPVISRPAVLAVPAVPARSRVTFKDGTTREFIELRDAIITAANA